LKSTAIGVAEAKVVGYMKNDPTIQSSPISFSVTIIDYKVPLIPDQIYIQSSAPLKIFIEAF
jgi:hypothetical protein